MKSPVPYVYKFRTPIPTEPTTPVAEGQDDNAEKPDKYLQV